MWLPLLAGALVIGVLSSPADAITNGTNATAGQQPFMVALVETGRTNADGMFCGGSLIDASWVLTAAHCVLDVQAADLEVLVGATDLASGEGDRVDVDDIVIDPDYNDPDESANDVALLHLADPQSIATIDLADDDREEEPGTQLRLTGWGGITNDAEPVYPTDLQQADMPVVSDSTCAEDLGAFDFVSIVCAGSPAPGDPGGVGSCYGDSGGPLFAIEPGGWLQVGIVSFGGETCANSYSAYASVASARSFIDATIGGSAAPTSGVTRIAGSDRFHTAAQLAIESYDPGVDAAYVVTGATFPDALAAAPAAAVDGGPVLLTERDHLPAATASALDELEPASIVVVGGVGAVSDAVLDALGALTDGSVTRVAGATRYDTAVALSSRAFPSTAGAIYLASGAGFADALSGAAAAAALPSSPLLLTAVDALPDSTRAEIERIAPDVVFVLGGRAAISDPVIDEITGLGIDVERVAGADRYATSALLADQWDGSDEIVLATGESFPDGLVAAALGLPLLLVPHDHLPSATADAIDALDPSFVLLLGGTAAVNDSVLDAVAALL